MLNKDFLEIEKKHALFKLVDQKNKTFTDYENNYVLLWYDARVKNYFNLTRNLTSKKISTTRILPILVVEKPEQNW